MQKLLKISCLLTLFLILSTLVACQILQQNTLIIETVPAAGEIVSATGAIGVTFKLPMDAASIEDFFSISPDVEGAFTWEENTLWFIPSRPLTPGETYRVEINGDLTTLQGKKTSINQHWDFSIREPELIYFQLSGEWGEIWRAAANGENQHPLTETDGRVIDFAPSPTGDLITFSLENQAGGSDLWIMDRDGNDQQSIVNCEQDHCHEPTWNWDQTQIAFTRDVYQPETGAFIASQIWILDLDTGSSSQLDSSDGKIGNSPSFSPDGEKLAYYDLEDSGIRVVDLQTSQAFFFPSEIPGSGDWSPDSSKIIFTDIMPAEHEPFVEIYIADLTTREITPAFNDAVMYTEFSQPRWSSADSWIAVALRPVNSGISKILWVLQLGTGEQQLIVDEPSATFSAYQWDPWGNHLIYQRLKLGSSLSQISIWLWDWETEESYQIIEIGGRPAWLP